ncbi:FAD-dependent monooxygenase [Oerskovia sp. M15]
MHDRRPPPGTPASGLGLNLPGNALRALAQLGVAEEVTRTGMRIRRREYRSRSGRTLFAVDEESFWGDVGPSVCLRRAAVLDALRTGVSVRWGTEVVRVEPAETSVRVRLASGPAEEYDYVVGADGVHSAVRPAVTGDDTLRPSLMSATSWRFLAPSPGWSAGPRGQVVTARSFSSRSTGRRSTATCRPRAVGRASTISGGSPTPPCAFRGRCRSGRRRLGHPDGLYRSPVEEVHAERWSRGRVTLIGDAAHAMGPVWAQGAALALEDGLVLAELLARRDGWDVVGTDLERLRRPGWTPSGPRPTGCHASRDCRSGGGSRRTGSRPASVPRGLRAASLARHAGGEVEAS